jgi:small conductance mechanosensitive channel
MPDLTKPPWYEIVAWLRADGFHILLVLVVAFLAQRLGRVAFHGIVKALLDREAAEGTAQELSAIEVHKRIDTLDELGSNVIRFLVFVIAALMILRELGLDIGPAIAGLGVVGIAVGFGAQSLVRDYLNGALILVENQYSKGDVVSIAGVTGTVEDFSLRRTTLRDLDGIVHTVPNGEIKVASNRTRTWARINQNVMVAFGTDIDKAIEVVDGVGREMTNDPVWKRRILEPPRVERVESIDEMGITSPLGINGSRAIPGKLGPNCFIPPADAIEGVVSGRYDHAPVVGSPAATGPNHVPAAGKPGLCDGTGSLFARVSALAGIHASWLWCRLHHCRNRRDTCRLSANAHSGASVVARERLDAPVRSDSMNPPDFARAWSSFHSRDPLSGICSR